MRHEFHELTLKQEYELRDITHHYPEWKRHEAKLTTRTKRVPMELADFFKEPDAGYIPCHALTDAV